MKENTLGKPCEKRSGFPAFAGKKTVALKDTCVLIMGQSPSSESYNVNGKGLPFYQGNADFGEDNPTPRSWCTDPKKIAEKGDILISVRAPIGAINIANERCCIGRGIAAIRPNQDLTSTNFLRHQLSASRSKLEAMGTGSTFKAIGKKALSDFAIALYSKSEQEVIVHQLDCIAAQIKAANNQLIRFDALIKSRFVEMFGDLLKNSKGQTLGDISELITVGIANAATHAYADKGTIMLRNLNIRENRLDDTDLISIRPEFAAKYKKKALKSGDILVTRTGYPGVACIVPEKYAGCQTFTTLIVRLDASSGASATFVSQYINSPLGKEYVNKMKAGSSQQNFGATSLKSMPIVVPPLALQQEFADFVSQVDKLRFAVQQQIDRLEMLKKSLLQEYFS